MVSCVETRSCRPACRLPGVAGEEAPVRGGAVRNSGGAPLLRRERDCAGGWTRSAVAGGRSAPRGSASGRGERRCRHRRPRPPPVSPERGRRDREQRRPSQRPAGPPAGGSPRTCAALPMTDGRFPSPGGSGSHFYFIRWNFASF